MKMNLAVYTATRGYAWQTNSSYTVEDFKRFEKLIGDFPSVNAPNFPFGKIFLDGLNVCFCRFHIAKRYDFSGRDAFYCIVGAIPRVDAARINPIKLFALPEFASPMTPPPTSVEIDSVLRDINEENLNILHLLKTCNISIDGISGEGALSTTFDLNFISLLERYDYSQKGSIARNELYQKVKSSIENYKDLRLALSNHLVSHSEFHEKLFAYLETQESKDLRKDLSQQLINTVELRQILLDYLNECSPDLRTSLTKKLLEKREIFDVLKRSQSPIHEKLCDCLFDTETFRKHAFDKVLQTSELKRELFKQSIKTSEYLNVLKEKWKDLDYTTQNEIILSACGRTIFYQNLGTRPKLRDEVYKQLFPNFKLSTQEIENAIEDLHKKIEKKKQEEEKKSQKNSSWFLSPINFWRSGWIEKIIVIFCVILIGLLLLLFILLYRSLYASNGNPNSNQTQQTESTSKSSSGGTETKDNGDSNSDQTQQKNSTSKSSSGGTETKDNGDPNSDQTQQTNSTSNSSSDGTEKLSSKTNDTSN